MWLEDDREKSVDIGSGSWIADVAAAEGTDRIDLDALQAERLARARDILREGALSAFLCFEAANIRYLTGLPPEPWDERDRARCILLTAGEGPFLLESGPASEAPPSLGPGRDAAGSPGNHPERARALELRPDELLWIPADSGRDPFAPLLHAGIGLHRKLRHPELSGRLGLDRLDAVEGADPAVGQRDPAGDLFADARPLLLRARSLKDMEELECLRFVTDIVDIVFQMARAEWLRPERTEREIAARCQEFLISSGFESVEGVMCAAGANSLLPRGLPTDHAIKEGELVILGIRATGPGGCRVRAQRTFKCGGKIRPEENALYRRCHQAMRLVMANCRPGQKVLTLLDVLREDESLPRPVGHALGLDWDEGYGLGPDERPVEAWEEFLPENLYLTLRVHAREGDFAVGLEENFLVSAQGPIYFTCFPLEKDLL